MVTRFHVTRQAQIGTLYAITHIYLMGSFIAQDAPEYVFIAFALVHFALFMIYCMSVNWSKK